MEFYYKIREDIHVSLVTEPIDILIKSVISNILVWQIVVI